jgi:hypothetical protein
MGGFFNKSKSKGVFNMKHSRKLWLISAIILVVGIIAMSCDTNPDPCESGHTFTQWQETTAPTCTSAGEETEKCSVCGKLGTATQPIAKIAHDYEDGICKKCGHNENEGSPCEVCEHDPCECCDDCGNYPCDCATICQDCEEDPCVCGDPDCEHEESKLGEPQTIPATCTSKGSITRTCECGYNDIQTLNELSHTYTTDTIHSDKLREAATCIKKATYWKSCKDCGTHIGNTTAYFEHGDFASHTYTIETVHEDKLREAPTCSKKATYWNSCKDCGTHIGNTTEYFEHGNLLNHNYTAELVDINKLRKAANCEEAATYWKSCVYCYTIVGNSTAYFSSGNKDPNKHADNCDCNAGGEACIVCESESCTGTPGLEIEGTVLKGRGTAEGGVICIPDSVTSIAECAFSYYDLSNYMFIADNTITRIGGVNVVSIGGWAFNSCNSLIEVDFPEAIFIGEEAFANCYNLESVSFQKLETLGVYYDEDKIYSSGAFSYCTSLKTVYMPKLKIIGKSAFINCEALESVSFPEVTYIGMVAFVRCTNLTSVLLPNLIIIENAPAGVSGIFTECPNLTSVSLPSIERIGNRAFRDTSITSLELPAEIPLLGSMVFNNANLLIYVPSGSVGNYKSAGGTWTTAITNGVHAIGCPNTQIPCGINCE